MRIGDSAGVPPPLNTEGSGRDKSLINSIIEGLSSSAAVLHDKHGDIANALKNLKDDIQDLRQLRELTGGKLPQDKQNQIDDLLNTYNMDGLVRDAQGILDPKTRDEALSKISKYKLPEFIESLKDVLKGLT